jgi:competence protein ComEC
LLDDKNHLPKTTQRPVFVVLTKNTKLGLAEITEQYGKCLLVIDASNSLWKIKQWKSEAEFLHLQCFDVIENGAFEYNIP